MPFLHVSPELKQSVHRRRNRNKPFHTFVEPEAPRHYRPRSAKEGTEEGEKWQAELDEKLKTHERTVLMYATEGDVDMGGKQKHNYLIDVFNMAYNEHGVVVLTPNVVLAAIQSVVAKAVCSNAEKLRDLFVDHEGQKDLVAVLNAPIGEYSLPQFMHLVTDMIKKNIKENYPLTDTGLSTSTPETSLANAVQTMATFQEYFRYGGMCSCGYRGIRLEGTPEDWVTLDAKFKATRALFAKMRRDDPLSQWFRITQLVMDRLVEMAALPDGSQLPLHLVRFVNSAFVKCPQGSGGDYLVSGWLGTSLTPVFTKGGRVITVGKKGECSFFDPSTPVPDWNDKEYADLGCYKKQDVFYAKVREWSGNFVQDPSAYVPSTNQVPFEMNDHGLVSDIVLSAGIGALSVKPCKDLEQYAYQVDDVDTKYIDEKNKDGSWKIPDGYTTSLDQVWRSRHSVEKPYKRDVVYNEYHPVVTVAMVATLKTEADVTANAEKGAYANSPATVANAEMREQPASPEYVKKWRAAYSRAALFQRELQAAAMHVDQ